MLVLLWKMFVKLKKTSANLKILDLSKTTKYIKASFRKHRNREGEEENQPTYHHIYPYVSWLLLFLFFRINERSPFFFVFTFFFTHCPLFSSTLLTIFICSKTKPTNPREGPSKLPELLSCPEYQPSEPPVKSILRFASDRKRRRQNDESGPASPARGLSSYYRFLAIATSSSERHSDS